MRRRRVSFFPDPRWTALKRAGVAVAAALVLLLAVLWFGESGQPPRSVVEYANDAPAQQPSMPGPQLDTVVPMPDLATTDDPAETPVPAKTPALMAADAADTPLPAVPTLESQTVTPLVAAKASEAPVKPSKASNGPTKPPKVVNAPVKPVSLQNGYFVQLGVFDDTDNTDRVFDNAVALGLPAYIQSRVMVGPFRNKREAEAARDRLKNIAEGVVLPPQKTAKADENPKAKQRRRAK